MSSSRWLSAFVSMFPICRCACLCLPYVSMRVYDVGLRVRVSHMLVCMSAFPIYRLTTCFPCINVFGYVSYLYMCRRACLRLPCVGVRIYVSHVSACVSMLPMCQRAYQRIPLGHTLDTIPCFGSV